MGIPKFYRWLSERYPLINQPGGATVIPIIDNLYLDMNGIIHNCTHGNNNEVKLTEDEMIVRIFQYLDKLFHIVKPQKLLFMAIDGVAPRAKMNQQRARRFKSAKEAEEAAIAAARRGETVADGDSRFDSNCITPGTPFMARLGAHLRFFIRKKISEDPTWQKPSIVFSGHDVPGEGEHKIMEYIRWARKDPKWAPNTRHCLYGLDADLVMLSLVTHEPHFCLLREVVSYTGGNRGQPAREVLENPCQEHFVLLQIGLLRDYLGLEFGDLKLPFAFDVERIVDDFVLFCMLVGNDFLPPLPTVDIAEGSLDALFSIYKELLPVMGGYLTFAGDLHRGRLELLLKRLADMEADVLELRANDTEEYESKKDSRRGGKKPDWASSKPATAKKIPQSELDEDDGFALEMAALALQQEGHELELLAAVESEIEIEEDDDGTSTIIKEKQVDTGPTMMSREARNLFLNGDKEEALLSWKARYYKDKMGLSTEEERRGVVESYIQGLHWVLEYYYRGVASWNWFYPYHYAPMASDMVNVPSIIVQFDQGEPFFPYEQLLAVQPASSFRLLPQPYQHLMTEATSPIVDFYPVEFAVDLEGKRAEWEGVVLIPFIDEERLLKASRSVSQGQLSSEEKARNTPGSILVFRHDSKSIESSFCESTLPAHYGDIAVSCSKMTSQAAPPPLPTGEKGFVPQFVVGTKVGAGGPPGFPTLKTLAMSGELRRAGINVFGTTSRKESYIVTLTDQFGINTGSTTTTAAVPTAVQVASAIVGQRAWVKWPYLQESVVEAVSDATTTAKKGGVVTQHSSDKQADWLRDAVRTQQEYVVKHGVDLGEVQLLLHVRPCEGLVRQIDGTVEKRFAKKEVVYPLQVTLRRNPAPDPRFQPDTVSDTLLSLNLKENSTALFLGRAHYGCLATILPSPTQGLNKKGQEITASQKAVIKGIYRVEVSPAPLTAGQAAQAAKRMLSSMVVTGSPSGQVARRLGVSSRTLGRMTSNVWVRTGEERRDRVDVGLCIKNAKNGVYVPDYAIPNYNDNSYNNNRNNNNPNSSGGGTGTGEIRGWSYSDAMVRLLDQYKTKFPFVWAALEKDSGGEYAPKDLTLEDLFPGLDKDAAMLQLAGLQKWLKSQPLARRPLIKLTSKVASEMAIKMLQAALPPSNNKPLPGVELENVAATLLLPPLEAGGPQAALAGGSFDIADRVVYVGGGGVPVFGSRGTVVAVHDEAIEVLFDVEFSGGTDLFGRCNGNCGGFVPSSTLLNLSKPHAVKAEGDAAPRAVRSSSSGAAPGVQYSSVVNGSGSSGIKTNVNNSGQKVMSASDALAAAMRGLKQQQPAVNQPPSQLPVQSTTTTTTTTATVAVKTTTTTTGTKAAKQGPKIQPKIPDGLGGRGFSVGRGRSLPIALPPQQQQPSAPGSRAQSQSQQVQPAPPPVPSSGAFGSSLLAQLQRSGSSVGAGSAPIPPPVLPSQQQQQAAGMQLLTRLQSGSAPPPPAQQQKQQQPAVATTAIATVSRSVHTSPSGQHLLAQLQSVNTTTTTTPAAPLPPRPPPAPAAGSMLLQQLQKQPRQQQPGVASPAVPPPSMPPPPSSGLLAGASSTTTSTTNTATASSTSTTTVAAGQNMSMDQFWAKLQGGSK